MHDHPTWAVAAGVATGGVLALVTVIGVVTLALPGSSTPAHRASAAATTTSATAAASSAAMTSTTTTTTMTTGLPTATLPPATVPRPTVPPTTAPPPAPRPNPVAALPGVAGAGQVITVTTTGYGTDVATVTAYELQGGAWQRVFGPYAGDVGLDGLAPQGEKREGDLRTPSGTFGFGTFFGIYPDPGVRFPYLGITGSWDVWDDDPSSPDYNQWVDEQTQGQAAAGAGPEPMDNAPSYDYGAVIDYNTDPVVSSPPMGSAIFFHVATGGATAGCVAVPQGELVPLLQWLDPAQSPRIVIGTQSELGLR